MTARLNAANEANAGACGAKAETIGPDSDVRSKKSQTAIDAKKIVPIPVR